MWRMEGRVVVVGVGGGSIGGAAGLWNPYWVTTVTTGRHDSIQLLDWI